jgi:hypothetical protein
MIRPFRDGTDRRRIDTLCPMSDTVEFRWDGFDPSDPDADEALYRLKREGADAVIPAGPERGIAVVPVILGAVAVVALAKAIKSFLDDLRPGMVIDVREEQIKITKDKALGRGTVLFIDKDGSTRLENPNSEKLSDLLASAVSGLKG